MNLGRVGFVVVLEEENILKGPVSPMRVQLRTLLCSRAVACHLQLFQSANKGILVPRTNFVILLLPQDTRFMLEVTLYSR
jgi:hypothetical protein